MKTIALTKPLGPPDRPVRTITLREPIYRDYMDLGNPSTLVRAGEEGSVFMQTTPSIVDAYVQRLVDIDPNFLHDAALADTLAIEDAVLDFFRQARTRPTPSAASPANSSGAPGSPPAT